MSMVGMSYNGWDLSYNAKRVRKNSTSESIVRDWVLEIVLIYTILSGEGFPALLRSTRLYLIHIQILCDQISYNYYSMLKTQFSGFVLVLTLEAKDEYTNGSFIGRIVDHGAL